MKQRVSASGLIRRASSASKDPRPSRAIGMILRCVRDLINEDGASADELNLLSFFIFRSHRGQRLLPASHAMDGSTPATLATTMKMAISFMCRGAKS